MKKISVILTFFIFAAFLPVFADDDADTGSMSDMMKYTNTVETGFLGQKPVTDEEFQKALEQVKAKQKKRKSKPALKGKNFNDENSGKGIDETAAKNILLSVPLNLINGDGTEIPIGHYKIVGEKKDNGIYLNFYQSSTLVAKVPAIETNNDFGKIDINFVELQPYNEKRVRILFGSMDFNAYTFINIEKPIADNN